MQKKNYKRPEVVIFKAYNKRIYAGEVHYNDNWFNEWKEGKEPSLLYIQFKDEDVPPKLYESNIPEIIDYANREFKSKIGMTWEEFCNSGSPEYKEIKEQVDKILEDKAKAKVRGLRAKAGILDDAPVGIKIDVKLDEAKEKLRELEEEIKKLDKENDYQYKGWKVRCDDGSCGKLYMERKDC